MKVNQKWVVQSWSSYTNSLPTSIAQCIMSHQKINIRHHMQSTCFITKWIHKSFTNFHTLYQGSVRIHPISRGPCSRIWFSSSFWSSWDKREAVHIFLKCSILKYWVLWLTLSLDESITKSTQIWICYVSLLFVTFNLTRWSINYWKSSNTYVSEYLQKT